MSSVSITNPANSSTVTLTGHSLPSASAVMSGNDYSSIEEAKAKVYLSTDTAPTTPPSGAVSASFINDPDVSFGSLPCPGSDSSATYKIAIWVTTDVDSVMAVNTFTGNT
ncbi:MAG: hypothetical protein ACO1RA_16315 [Planctomycetaceae bacterium]